MVYYLFDYQTKEFIGEMEIDNPKQYDPRIPGNAVPTCPPYAPNGQVQIWNGLHWDLIDKPNSDPEEPTTQTPEQVKAQKIIELNQDYSKYLTELAIGYSAAQMDDNTALMQDLKSERAAVLEQYQIDLQAILSE